VSNARLAITGQSGTLIVDNVTVRGLIIERFANQRRGAISAFGGSGWDISNNEVRDNHGCGIGAGPHATVTNNSVHHNGQIGMCGQGEGILIENNTIAWNNTEGFNARWEGGGSKWVNTTDLVVRGNTVVDNQGPGLWADWNNKNTLYENNVVRRNFGEGIFHEASYSAMIRNNVVTHNNLTRNGPWGAGIMVSSSIGVRVVGNTVAYNTNGIAVVHVDRGTADLGRLIVRDVTVKRNTVVMNQGYTGFYSRTTDYVLDGSIDFSQNSYNLLNGTSKFMWLQKMGISDKDWKKLAGDKSSTFSTTVPKTLMRRVV
jgi:parallel beta-helix repeat protein